MTRGFSLPEILVSMFLISLTALFVVEGFSALSAAVEHSRNRWYAIQAADNEIQSLRFGLSTTAPSSWTLTPASVSHGNTYQLVLQGRDTIVSTGTGPSRSLITVAVDWTDPSGSHEVVVQTVRWLY